MLIASIVLALLGPVIPDAAPSPAEDAVSWAAPDTCPSADGVRQRIVAYLGGAPQPGSVTIDAMVQAPAEGGYRLDVTITSSSGTTRHSLHADACETLADAVALVAAVALDPVDVAAAIEAARTPVASEPAPNTAPEPDPEVAPPPVREPRPEPAAIVPKRRPLRFGLRPDFALDFGPLPKLGVGGGFTGTVLSRGWRVELGLVMLAPRSAASSRVASATADVSLVAGRARGCGVLGRTVVEFPLCGGVEIGALRGRGTGATIDAHRGADIWAAAIVGPSIAVVPRRFIAIHIGVDGVFPFARPAFDLGGEIVHRSRRAGVRAGLGVEIRVP